MKQLTIKSWGLNLLNNNNNKKRNNWLIDWIDNPPKKLPNVAQK